MSALTRSQLVQLGDGEFDDAVQGMSTKNLIDTITALQSEMSREQENFNSLSSELGGLKKNSGQYKSISKDLTVSQTRLTLLMNRSMKCFNAQGNKSKEKQEKNVQSTGSRKPEVIKAENQSVSKPSTPPVNGNNKPVYTQQTSRNSSSGRTAIQVQSLKPSNSAVQLRASEINGANNDDHNKKTFDEKKNIVSDALPFSRSRDSLENGSAINDISEPVMTSDVSVPSVNDIETKTAAKTDKVNDVESKSTVVEPRTVSSNASVNLTANSGPIAKQKSASISTSVDSVVKPTPEVVKSSIKPTKPASRVVMNADKQMIDLDSFTERKNMLTELKGFDKHLKPVQNSGKSLSAVNVGFGQENGRPDTNNGVQKVQNGQTKGSLLADIKLAKKPSEIKENVSAKEDSPRNKSPTQSESNPTALFDDLLKDVDDNAESESSEKFESSKDSPREGTNDVYVVEEEVTYVKNQLQERSLDEVDSVLDTHVVKPTKDIRETRAGVDDAARDTESEGSEKEVEEDDRFVTEFKFPGKPATKQEAPSRPKAAVTSSSESKQTTQPVSRPTTTSNSASSAVVARNPLQVVAAKPDVSNQGAIPKVKVGEAGGKVQPVRGQGQLVKGQDEDDGEELVKDSRVKFRDWDPVKVYEKLYEIKMMPDTIEDISHRFIGMEGLMEKLPMNKKKATLLKTWKRRFFRAQDGWLHYYESGQKDKPSDSLQLMGGKVEELGPRVLGVDDGRGKYLMVRVPTDHEYGQWKVALESQTADNVKATYIRPSPASIPHPSKKVVIIDIGSASIRAGILCEKPTLPQLFFPSVVAVNKQTGEIIVGEDAMKPDVRHTCTVVQPIQPTNKVDKFNIDMTVMVAIFKKVFTELKIEPSRFLVMLSTPQKLGDKLKGSLMEILLNQLRVRGVCMVPQTLLALYSYNTTSGICVDIGERLDIMPIYEGVLIEGGVSRQAYGGTKIQDSLYISLLENKFKFNTPVEKILVRYICENACYVTDDYERSKRECDKDSSSYTRSVNMRPFDLPEGAYASVELDQGFFKSPEGFFNTDLWEMDYKNLQKQIYAAIQQCPMDSRKHMYRSVYLSGGVTVIPGFVDRLQEELRKLAPPSVLVEVHASPQRYHAAYIGACAVAGMEVFEMSCVLQDEWKRLGVKACKKWGTD